jgi:hypothetical protein
MADLKEINEDAILHAIAQTEADAHERIARAAQQAAEEVKQVVAARATLPARSMDLLQDAAVAEVDEIDLSRHSHYDNGREIEIGAYLTLNGSQHSISAGNSNQRAHVKPGRYRALFFLLPLPDVLAKKE